MAKGESGRTRAMLFPFNRIWSSFWKLLRPLAEISLSLSVSLALLRGRGSAYTSTTSSSTISEALESKETNC